MNKPIDLILELCLGATHIPIHLSLSSSLVFEFHVGLSVYWDGLFSGNPPTNDHIDDKNVGKDNIPDQLWMIEINPTQSETIPETSAAVTDRCNEMIGAASFLQELMHIGRVNNWVRLPVLQTYQWV